MFLNSDLGVAVGAMAEFHNFFIDPLVLRTTDHGVHWIPAAVPGSKGTGFLESVCFTRDGTGLAVGSGQMASPVAVLTTDMASTWVDVTDRMDLGAAPTDAACAGDADLWIVGLDFQAFHSADRGATWTDAIAPIRAVVAEARGPADGRTISAIEFTDPRSGWASGVDGDGHTFVLRTIDGGKTWKSQLQAFQPYEVTTGDLFFTPDGRYGITLGAGGTQPFAFVTSDAGNTWTPSAIPADRENGRLTIVGSITDFAIVP